MRKRKNCRGNAVIEFGLIALPLLFMAFGSFEVGRAFWIYHTMAAAVKTGARFAMVHGVDCVQASASCQASVADVASIVRTSGVGLDASRMSLTLTDGASQHACGTLHSCLADTTPWPSSDGGHTGQPVSIQGKYAFDSVMSLMWPGQKWPVVTYSTSANEVIEF